jgi:hypothetical protein
MTYTLTLPLKLQGVFARVGICPLLHMFSNDKPGCLQNKTSALSNLSKTRRIECRVRQARFFFHIASSL